MSEDNKKTSVISENLLKDFPPHSDEDWRKAVDKLLKGKPYEKIMLTNTYEGIQLEPIYRLSVLKDLPQIDDLPGFNSYVRNTKPEGYTATGWQVAQEISSALPMELNKNLLDALNRGQNAVNIVLDKASLKGKDPKQSRENQVGKNGTSIATLADLETALDDVVLDAVDIQIQAYHMALPYATMLMQLAKQKDKKIRGCVGMDPLSYLAEHGTLPASLKETYDDMFQLTNYAKKNHPGLRTIAIHTQPYHEAGASAVEELSFGFATAVEYVNEMLDRGLSIDEVAPHVQFNFALGSNLFMEIAKLRAARMIWKNIVENYGGNQESQKIYMHVRTSKFNKTKYDPYVNMLRTTTEAFSGVIGGADSLHVGCFDEVLRSPDDFSRRIARNQQLILAEEVHLSKVIDPAGGSWYIEKLTDELAKTVWKNFQITQEAGGMSKFLKENQAQEAVKKVATARRKNIACREDVIVGTNMYANMEEKFLTPRKRDYKSLYEIRSKEIRKPDLKIEIDKDDVVESVMQLWQQGATINQIHTALHQGTTEVQPLEIHRASKFYEQLRNKTEKYFQKTGERPQVFLANYGTVYDYKGRADFSRGFFETAGFAVEAGQGFEEPEKVIEEALQNSVKIVVICSTDKKYKEIVEKMCQAREEMAADKILILAGNPKADEEKYKKAGIDKFIHLRVNAYDILADLLQKVGVE
jgi:methylmalonyl-CoA mutase